MEQCHRRDAGPEQRRNRTDSDAKMAQGGYNQIKTERIQ